ncbi:MAG: hypothetical protein H7844_03545 [Nitrospirae bacterium YQR-1]
MKQQDKSTQEKQITGLIKELQERFEEGARRDETLKRKLEELIYRLKGDGSDES